MTILRITSQPVDERSVAADLGIGKGPAHFGEKSVDRVGVETIFDEIPVQFVEDVVGPECSIQPALRLAEQGVTQVRRVDDARIEHDGERHGPSPCALRNRRPLVHVGLVGDLHHPIESRTAFDRTALPVGENIGEADPIRPYSEHDRTSSYVQSVSPIATPMRPLFRYRSAARGGRLA